MSVEVQHLTKTFGKFTALRDINLQVKTGELVALLGPSGSGKTTLLRIIAGLDFADEGSGQILYAGQDVTPKNAYQRRAGFVFQQYALFQHLNVTDNIAFGLKVRPAATRPSKSEILERVQALLKLVQLENLANRYPSQLSGGQRQRIALARALAIEPQVLLLDEPFGALDAKVRKELRRWLRNFHDETHLTSLFVTHDQDEAFEVADRVVVMSQGKIEQIGTPQEVYDRPANAFVYEFLGNVNQLRGHVVQGKLRIGEIELNAPDHVQGQTAVAYVRPHDVDIAVHSNGQSSIEAIIREFSATGPVMRLSLERLDNQERVEAEVPRKEGAALDLYVGRHVYLTLRTAQVVREDFSI
jgi:sulfate transport system ATP-binding protein